MAHAKSTDPNVFILPDLGEGLEEAELIAWKVEEGQAVAEHEILAEMETDKALVEVPSPRAGTIGTLHGGAGDIIKVGAPLVTYAGGSSNGQTQQPSRAEEPPPQSDRKTIRSGKKPAEPAPEPAASEEREDVGTVVGKVGDDQFNALPGKALATPAVRRLARDMGVDIDTVRGTGIGGRVTKKDVESAPAGGAAPARPAPALPDLGSAPARASAPTAPPPAQKVTIPQGEDTARIPFRGVRRKIAQRLRDSVDTAVHFTVMDEADVSELDALRKRLGAASGEKVSFLPFVCSAVCRALTTQFGALNATVDEAAEEIVQHRSVHMGIAADTENGLMVPVVPSCDRLGVLEISRAVAQLATSARDRSIPREQLSGSTFTISNVGSYAGRFATPVINAPEVGILAVGRTREGMVTKNGWFRVGKMMPLSLACDHRVVDGATAALCLAEVVRLLQDAPESLLTPAR
ncbi:MAG: dihydrolipoyllysine-residue acetyltransferase component of pyruvate dehydrogenase complex [Phycisphaeraceae bacterium]|nr:MAG: dihydrolipoyllysine-residue acetyltransferase component of pyruvate dehydrogenase complex [Phycisphaeraceae bacterium]